LKSTGDEADDPWFGVPTAYASVRALNVENRDHCAVVVDVEIGVDEPTDR
jgi:hypothetical protein